MEVFCEAAAARPAERDAYLDGACRDDVALREEVESLLRTQQRVPAFLEAPTVDGGSIVEAGEDDVGLDTLSVDRGTVHVGRYTVVRRVGEGGFGVVYAARQNHPIRRDVALKIVRLGMDSRRIIARFEQERQALALMEHPHIARVFDAGATESGRPFFVMELVALQNLVEEESNCVDQCGD